MNNGTVVINFDATMHHRTDTNTFKRLETLKAKRGQIDAEIVRHTAAEAHRHRKQETARKIEVGALLLHHVRENPDSEVRRIVRRLLNRYVPKHRRHLFIAEFDISPSTPRHSTIRTGSNRVPPLRQHFTGSV